jgi:hypothetical protein
MKGVIAATAVLLTALTLVPQAQARDLRFGQRGQDHGRYDNRSHDRPNDSRPAWNGHNDWNGHGNGNGHNNWNNGHNDWRDRHDWGARNDWSNHNDWRGHDGWNNRDSHRWGRPDYRPNYGYRYPHYYYDRPYYGYGYGSRYGYPPVYGSAYSYDCGYYSYSDCYDDDGFTLLLSLPLHF